jgi:hypothetical protein
MVLTCFDVYDSEKLTKYNFICNAGVAKDYWQNGHTDAVGTPPSSLLDPIVLDDIHRRWTLKQWNKHLMEMGVVTDPNWWRTHFLPTLKRHVAYYIKINLIEVASDPRMSGLFAFDASVN